MTNNCANEIDKPQKTQRLFYLDVLRVIACLCVIMVHASAGFVTKDFGSYNFWVGNVFDSLSRIGVPLFVMISGSIFLDENYNYTIKKLINHIKKIVLFFVFWSLLYTAFFNILIPLIKHRNISAKTVIAGAVLGHYHLWFCFMIVGLYLIVPLLRLWVKKENIEQVKYFILLSFIFTMFLPSIIEYLSLIYPIFGGLNTIVNNVNIKYVGGFTVYFILGWFFNNIDIKHKKLIVVLGVCGLSISVVGTAFLSMMCNESHTAYGNLSVHVALQAIMVYVMIKNKYEKISLQDTRYERMIMFISKNSLGVYAIHAAFVTCFNRVLVMLGVANSIICIPMVFGMSFIISLFISFVLGKIPVLKQFV